MRERLALTSAPEDTPVIAVPTKLMTIVGTDYLVAVISGDYILIWVSTPGDWYVRTPRERVAPHWSRIQSLLTKAKKARMQIMVFCPPRDTFGSYLQNVILWKILS
eukprot:8322750-Pyramimonas_sp.AAC.1